MKLNEHNQEHLELIARYLANEMDENERANFEIDIALDPENTRLIDEMKREWTMIKRRKNSQEVNVEDAWNKLNSRLEAENLRPASSTVQRGVGSRSLLVYAAVLVGFAVIGATFLWFGNSEKIPQMVNVINEQKQGTIVKTLADGSIVYVGKQSNFGYPIKFSQNERKVELEGLAYFDIARNPAKPFIIETKDAYVQVLGTAFNVRSFRAKEFELIVERGKVRVTLKSDPSVSQVVVAGERLVINRSSLQKSQWTDDGSLAWRLGKMQFKDETLQNIIKVINRNYKSNITIADAQTASRRLTVTFDESSLSTITELICITLNLQCTKSGESLVLASSNEN